MFIDAGCSVVCRALEVWGSMEALARERNLRKEVEQQYQESMYSLPFYPLSFTLLNYLLYQMFPVFRVAESPLFSLSSYP